MTAEEPVTAKSDLAVQVKRWESYRPGMSERMLVVLENEDRHNRHMDWVDCGLQVLGLFCGFGTVVVLALLARHFVDHGAAPEGAAIIASGAVSLVQVFFADRLRRRKKQS